MFISVNLLVHILLKDHPDWEINDIDNLPMESLHSIGILPLSGDQCVPGDLYICGADHPLLRQPEITGLPCYILAIAAPDFVCPENTLPFVLYTTEDPFFVLNEIIRIYSDLLTWDKNMDIEIIRQNDPQVIIDLSEDIIGHPLILFDGAMMLLANTRHLRPASAEDWVFRSASEKGFLMNRDISLFLEGDIFQRLAETGTIIEYDMFQKDMLNIYQAITIDKQLLGYYSVIAIDEKDLSYIKELSDQLISKLLFYFQKNAEALQAQQQRFDYLFSELIETPSMEEADMLDRMRFLEFSDETPFYLLQIPINNMKKRPQLRMKAEFSTAVFGSPAAIYGDSLFLLINAGEDNSGTAEEQLRHIQAPLNPLLQYYRTNCFVSLRFERMIFLRAAWLQCTFAAQHFAEQNKEHATGIFSFYDSIKADHLLDLFTEQMPAETLVHPALKKMLEQPSKKTEEQLEVLRCFLENNCNVTDTARALHRHRNSLLYHVQQIEDTYGIRFQDPWERVMLLISFKLV